MDFIPQILSIDNDSNALTLRLKPDPGRHEWREKNEKKYMDDKIDDILCPEKDFDDLSRQIENHRICLQPQDLNDLKILAQTSKPILEKTLKEQKAILIPVHRFQINIPCCHIKLKAIY